MKKEGTIIVVDDNRSMLTAVEILLNGVFERVVTLSSPTRLLNTLREVHPDVLLLDMNFSSGINSGNEGLYWLSEVKKASPDIEVVLFTAYADIDLAVKAMQRGATDFVVKPWNNAKLVTTLRNALALRRSRSEAKQLGDIKRSFSTDSTAENAMFWGTSSAFFFVSRATPLSLFSQSSTTAITLPSSIWPNFRTEFPLISLSSQSNSFSLFWDWRS